MKRKFFILLALCIAIHLEAKDHVHDASVPVEIFNPGYLEGDCNYHSLTAASDGLIYFTVSTHHDRSAARIFTFDPEDESIEEIGDLNEILATDISLEIPHGKIHTPLIEHEGYLYFSTHTAYYDGNLPDISPDDGRAPYPGGHFIRYHLKEGRFDVLAQLKIANEGIITMTLDPVNGTLYGLTWPTGLLISYNLVEGLLHQWGAVQQRGEWGPLPEEWNFICRRFAMDDSGNLYGATDTGRVWHFEKNTQRPVRYLEGINVADMAPPAEAGFEILPEPHFFWNNWRTILWNPNSQSFWGLQGGSTQLFEFKPEEGILRSVQSLRANGIPNNTRRNPLRSQLGFMLGPDNTLAYLAHAPGLKTSVREPLETSVHLMTYAIDSGTLKDHGPLVSSTSQRIFFAESLEIGANGHLYTVAWVESIDPDKMEAIQAARSKAAPTETDEVIYEMQLVQLPKWQDLMN
jgi:hypothetical protein